MLFRCLAPDGLTFIVESPSWMDVRHYMASLLGVSDPTVDLIPNPDKYELPELELRWSGHDAGSHARKRLEVRSRTDGRWSSWKPAK